MKPNLYSAPTVKEAIVGWDRADKAAVKAAVKLRVKEAPKNSHSVDACAVALYHADLMAVENKVIAGARR
jgi:Holliday junction resolvasome RuvABC endonuclease subunit